MASWRKWACGVVLAVGAWKVAGLLSAGISLVVRAAARTRSQQMPSESGYRTGSSQRMSTLEADHRQLSARPESGMRW